MNHRWQQMVMIATASIIIVLISYDHLQQQKKLREENSSLVSPMEIPDGFLWPKEILSFQVALEKRADESEEREELQGMARRYGLILQSTDTLAVWKSQIQTAKNTAIEEDVQKALQEQKITSKFAPKSAKEKPRLWKLALIGLQAQQIEDLVVMKYELTRSSAWLLGSENVQDVEACPFCAFTISFEESIILANRLSQSMGLESCYEKEEYKEGCLGWRMPTLDEWKTVRGPSSQKWEFMQTIPQEPKTPNLAGQSAPNIFEIHDIVGHCGEWSQQKQSIGADVSGDVHQELPNGVRFYRTEADVEP